MLTPSHNTTVKGSKGLVSTSDQAYTSLPSDSAKPAAPIDPSGEFGFGSATQVGDRWDEVCGMTRGNRGVGKWEDRRSRYMEGRVQARSTTWFTIMKEDAEVKADWGSDEGLSLLP